MTGDLITFKDLLDAPLIIDGLPLEATVTVTVRKCQDKSYEIEYFDMKDIYLHTEHHGLIKLDFSEGGNLLKERFINACELHALKKAATTPDYKYDEVMEYGA